MSQAESPPPNTSLVRFKVTIPRGQQFHRDHPAELEGPASAWEAARVAVDFACWVIQTRKAMRPDRQLRDSVLTALLRRATITTEAVVVLLSKGLEEPAFATIRTLLDIELSMKLITRDPTDRMAKRLAAYHYLGHKRHGQDLLAASSTRDELVQQDGSLDRLIRITRSYSEFLKMPIFDDVRDELKESRVWHGFDSVEAAFDAVDAKSDYLNTYDSATFFVHASNPDADFAERSASELRIKALVERSPTRVQLLLGFAVFRMHRLLQLLDSESMIPPFEQQTADADSEAHDASLDGLAGLTAYLLDAFSHVPHSD